MTPESEEWRPVVGYEGFYEVSNLGRIRGLDRIDAMNRRIRGRVIVLKTRDRGGHVLTTLCKERVKRTMQVHHLVLFAFVGPRPDGMEACHNNGKADDNRVENLRWDTASANCLDKVRHGTHPQASKTHCMRGHLLAGANLAPWNVGRDGWRVCLACSRARRRAWKAKAPLSAEEADAIYAELMGKTVNPTPQEQHEIERFGLSYSPEQTVQDMETFKGIVGVEL